MTARATDAAFDELHAQIAKSLKARLETDDFSASDMANAIKFLKDNGIDEPAASGKDESGDKIITKLQEITDKEKEAA